MGLALGQDAVVMGVLAPLYCVAVIGFFSFFMCEKGVSRSSVGIVTLVSGLALFLSVFLGRPNPGTIMLICFVPGGIGVVFLTARVAKAWRYTVVLERIKREEGRL